MPWQHLLAHGFLLLTARGSTEALALMVVQDDSVAFIQMGVGSLPFPGDTKSTYSEAIQAEDKGSTRSIAEADSRNSSTEEGPSFDTIPALELSNGAMAINTEEVEEKDEGAENPQELFRQFDADSSGDLRFSELTEFLRVHWTASVTPAQVRKIIRKSDTDVNWAVSYREFLGCARRPAACDAALPRSLQHPSLEPVAEFERQQEDTPNARLSATGPAAPLGALADSGLTGMVLPKWPKTKTPEAKECSDVDREILRAQGLRVWGQEGVVANTDAALVDHLRMQTLHIGGAWAHTLLLPGACQNVVAHGADLDRGAYADCLQETLNLTVPCGKCQADYLQSMVHNCADTCTHNLNSDACVDCAEPLTLVECIEGLERFEEFDLASLEIKGAPLPAGSVEDDESPTDDTEEEDVAADATGISRENEVEAHEINLQAEEEEPEGVSNQEEEQEQEEQEQEEEEELAAQQTRSD
mmetsp:Transcript_5602/g.13059  ORF Transcript_5602/g.13059 Transcript_5602/m.13059 type:complete len:472 (+) Transcript_5602:90-1505(+)